LFAVFRVSGCSPLAAGMICDVFPQKQRGKAMSVYNCGMYLGYGLSYAVGIYVTSANLFGEVICDRILKDYT
jgi:sugar phosphate permease